MEERIKTLELALTTAQSEGRADEESNILQDLIKNKENHAKLKQIYSNSLAQYMMARQQAQAQASNPPQNQGEFRPLS